MSMIDRSLDSLGPHGFHRLAYWERPGPAQARARRGLCVHAHDPRIGDSFRAQPLEDVDLWAAYDAVRCPTLVLRGAESDLLRRADAEAMTGRGPRARVVEFAGIGHAPALMAADQIAAVSDFLRGG